MSEPHGMERSDARTMVDDMTWRTIERDARSMALAALAAEEAVPLELWQPIAWVNVSYGRTDDLSPVHRVGAPVGGNQYTACHEAIPHPIRRMVLNPALIRTMAPCRFCEAEYERGHRTRIIHAA
jgi:hypothetical protein